MPATQRKCIYGGLTLDVDRHYIGSVTAPTHQEKGIITLESNPSRGTVLTAPHGKGNKCDKNVKYKRVEFNWLFNATINDISVIYVTAHRCASGLKKLDLRSGSQCHRHFAGFFNVPVQAPTRDHLFIR